MNYGLSLKTVGVLVGLLLIAAHAVALARPEETRRWLTRFPRSEWTGRVLLSVDFLWTLLLVLNMDWGEFYYLKTPIVCALPVFFYLVLRFVDEFLAVRALGILGLLAAAPVLDAAFLQPPVSRLLVVTLAYVWIIMGMIWIGQPHLLRDQIGWLLRSAARWQAATVAGIAYGVIVLLCAVVWY